MLGIFLELTYDNKINTLSFCLQTYIQDKGHNKNYKGNKIVQLWPLSATCDKET